MLLEEGNLAEYLLDGGAGGLGGHIGGDEEDDAVAKDLGLAIDAVGVAFVLADVAHQSRAEIAAQNGVEHHEGGIVGVVPLERQDAAYAEGRLDGCGHKESIGLPIGWLRRLREPDGGLRSIRRGGQVAVGQSE